MNLKFTTTEISEFATGNFHKVNDGKAFEVDAVFGRELLHAKHFLGGEVGWVNVFEEAGAAAAAEAAADEPDELKTLSKLSRAELQELAKEAGLDGDGYTNKKELATAIMAAKGE